MSRIIDLLAKLGILRYGTKAAVYQSAKDRPAEFMMDGVYNAKRDLVTGLDFKTDAERTAKAETQEAAGAIKR
jgi:hypothetical protein